MSLKRGLFINNKKAKDSIYESGFMVYQCLRLSSIYKLDYQEIDIEERKIKTGYDFYFFNYHPITMGWLQTRNLKKELGFVITMILEVAPGDPFVLCPDNDFDLYCVLDPTIKPRKNLFPFPRPLERIKIPHQIRENVIPIIGSFGFATRGKGFQHVVEAVNKEFDKAIVRINIPFGDYVPNSKNYALSLAKLCKEKAKPGIEVIVTHDFLEKDALITWCSENSLNCFLYDRQMPGLSATTDQAIASGRPLSVANNDTFRHILKYLKPYPVFSLKASIEKSIPLVEKMKDDWSPEKFYLKFEKILQEQYCERLSIKSAGTNIYFLPLKQNDFTDKLLAKWQLFKRKLNWKTFIRIIKSIQKKHVEIN